MSRPGSLRERAERFWFGTIPPHPLAAFRVFFGLYLFAYFGSFAPDVTLLFSREGVYLPYRLVDLSLPPTGAWLLYTAMMCAIVAFIGGFRTRILTPLILFLYLYFFLVNLAVKDSSYDRLNLILLFLACFASLDGAWAPLSKDGTRPHVEAWPARLIALQIALLYFGSGLWKLTNPYWHDGEMLRMTFAGPWGTGLAKAVVALDMPLVVWMLVVWSVTVLEIALPLLLWLRGLRPFGVVCGLTFHIAIWLLLDIPQFVNCVTTYVLFASPDGVREQGNRLLLRASAGLRRLAAAAG